MNIIPDKTSESVISVLKCCIKLHGIPIELIADNVPFSSYEMKTFAQDYGIKITTTSPRYPQSNGMSEMAVKTCKKILKKCEDPILGLL